MSHPRVFRNRLALGYALRRQTEAHRHFARVSYWPIIILDLDTDTVGPSDCRVY